MSESKLKFFSCADVLHVDKREYRRCLTKIILGAVLLFLLLVIVGFIIPVYIKGFPVPVRGKYLCFSNKIQATYFDLEITSKMFHPSL